MLVELTIQVLCKPIVQGKKMVRVIVTAEVLVRQLAHLARLSVDNLGLVLATHEFIFGLAQLIMGLLIVVPGC